MQFLQGLGFTKTKVYYSVFVSHDKSTFISVYIDDQVFIGENWNIINSLKNKLSKGFYLTNFGLIYYYLDMFVSKTSKYINLD